MFELGIIFLLSLFGMSPQVIAENQLQAVVQGNNHFTKQLYDVLSKEKGNVFFSPISAHAVLAMAYQGAKGSTYEAFTTTLGMPSHNQAALGYSHIIGNLNNVTDVQLLMANKIYTKKGYALKPAFKDVVQKTFSSEVESVNFSDSAASASKINSWVEDKTQNKIKDLIKPDDLDEYTRLVLINAIYFKGNWASKFDEKKTKTEKFYLNDNDSIDVKMMNKHSDYAFKEDYDLNAKVLELPYKNPDVSLVVILPNKRNGISELETKLANVSLDKVTENMYKREVIVKFPKFKVKTTIDLKGPLQQLGLGIIFDNSADFSEMLESPEPLHVSKAVQKAFIEVNEEGTEAAAATAVRVPSFRSGRVDFKPRQKEFKADHPFIVYLRIKNANSASWILFGGRISKPTEN